MKKSVIICMILLFSISYSQSKKNGTIYLEHPAIEIAEQMQQAFIKGDTVTLKNLLADDFKAFNGMNSNPDAKGATKDQMLKRSIFWVKNGSYLSIERTNGAYPDALEYKKDNKEGKVWVQTWDNLKGVHDKTGVKLDMPLHRLFVVNKDNKIERMITYDDGTIFDELRAGFSERTNGTIYNQHPYINKVRLMMAALEHGDADKGFSYFTENARFTNLDMAADEFHSVTEEKEGFLDMLKDWTIESIDVVGYPDYLEYELGGAKVVQSWWTARMTRKSDGKKVKLPLMMTHNFNDEGMITREIGYYTLQALSK